MADDATAYAHRRAELMFATTVIGPPPAIEGARPGLDALWARERQGKSGCPVPAAKPGRSVATRSARVSAVEPNSRVCIVTSRPWFRFWKRATSGAA